MLCKFIIKYSYIVFFYYKRSINFFLLRQIYGRSCSKRESIYPKLTITFTPSTNARECKFSLNEQMLELDAKLQNACVHLIISIHSRLLCTKLTTYKRISSAEYTIARHQRALFMINQLKLHDCVHDNMH